jgi:hypothetical protein
MIVILVDVVFVGSAVLGGYELVRGFEDTSNYDYGGGRGPAEYSVPLALIGTLGYLIAPPVVHGRYGNKSGAGKSVMLRLFTPVLGGVVGAIARGDDGGGEAVAYGFAGGVATAMIVDWFAVARREVPTSSYTPAVTPVRGGGMTFGIAGSF